MVSVGRDTQPPSRPPRIDRGSWTDGPRREVQQVSTPPPVRLSSCQLPDSQLLGYGILADLPARGRSADSSVFPASKADANKSAAASPYPPCLLCVRCPGMLLAVVPKSLQSILLDDVKMTTTGYVRGRPRSRFSVDNPRGKVQCSAAVAAAPTATDAGTADKS